MPKKHLVRLLDEPEDDIWFTDYLEDNPNYSPEEVDTEHQFTLEELADFCDRNAENRNNHAYNGSHRLLAAFLYRELGREQATHIMKEITEYGGLDGMNGIGGEPDAFTDFNISEYDEDWSLPA